jgi:ArsR family transcriptional regulator, arsenate/arsenite/antimonite-responsive transcriptional repressor
MLKQDLKTDLYAVITQFLDDILTQLKKQQIVLERLVEEFEPDRDYPEREVNQTLFEFHEDVAALRRGFIDRGLMTRERGVYRRV